MVTINKPKIKVGERAAVKYAAYAADAWQKEGDEVLKTISEAQHDLGAEYARAQIKAHGIKGMDARSAGAVFEKLLQELSVDHSVIEGTDKRFVVHTRSCPFLEEWKNAGVETEKLCRVFGNSFVQGLCEGVNPRLKYRVTRIMSEGTTYCEEKIELI